MNRIGVALVLAMLLALLVGCGGSKAPAATTPAPEKPAATAQVQKASPTEPADTTNATAPTKAPAPTVQATIESSATDEDSENAELELADDETALKDLKSYRTTWSFEWTGTKDGEEQIVKWLSVEAYTADPQAKYTSFETSNSAEPAQGGSMEFYQIGNKSYMVSQQDGKAQCTAFTSDPDDAQSSMLDRSAFGSIDSGRLVGEETVNGVRTKHYKYDEKSTGAGLFSRLSGDVWVAVDGGYVVKDVAEWEGNFFGLLGGSDAGDTGKGSWQREVTDINQAFEITPPEGCENAAEELPIMADASEQASFGSMTTYKSASKMADVVKFYEEEMAKAGWSAEGEPQVSDGFGSLTFAKDGKRANIMITSEDSMVNVIINVE